MKSEQARTAKAAREYLASLGWKGIRVTSERFAGGNAITVYLPKDWEGFFGIPEENRGQGYAHNQLMRLWHDLEKRYTYGKFDAMTDSYNYTTQSTQENPRVKYISLQTV